jgi:hypothetical protein
MRHVSLIFQLKTHLLPQKIRPRNSLLPHISLGSRAVRGVSSQRPRQPPRACHLTLWDPPDPHCTRRRPLPTRHLHSSLVPATPRTPTRPHQPRLPRPPARPNPCRLAPVRHCISLGCRAAATGPLHCASATSPDPTSPLHSGRATQQLTPNGHP